MQSGGCDNVLHRHGGWWYILLDADGYGVGWSEVE